MRVLVFWSICRGTTADEDERWVRAEAAKLEASDGVRGVALHRVESAALRHPRPWDWCLELTLNGEAPNAVVRRAPCADFLADLRLLGTRPSVVVLPEAA